MAGDMGQEEQADGTRQLFEQMSEAARLARGQWAEFAKDLKQVADQAKAEAERFGPLEPMKPLLRDEETALIQSMAELAIAMADLGERVFEATVRVPGVDASIARFDGLVRQYGKWALDRAIGKDEDPGPTRPPRRLIFELPERRRAVAVHNDFTEPAIVQLLTPAGYSVDAVVDQAQRRGPNDYLLQAGERLTFRVTANDPEAALTLLIFEMRPDGRAEPLRRIPVLLEYLEARPAQPDRGEENG